MLDWETELELLGGVHVQGDAFKLVVIGGGGGIHFFGRRSSW